MIESYGEVEELERRWEQETFRGLTFENALARFAALWVHARALNPHMGADWREDLEADLAVARAVNGLPPAP